MAQGLLQLPTTGTVSGLQNNQDANAALGALATMVQGGAAPTPASTGLAATAGVWWHDTANNLLKLRDQADTTWMIVGAVDEANKLVYAGGAVACGGGFKNLKISVLDNTRVAITADEVIIEDVNGNALRLTGVNVTVNLAQGGTNGLDSGANTMAASTWYSCWVIYDAPAATRAGLASASQTSPTLPSGYTHKARLGWVRADANTHLWRTIQYGRRAQIIVDGTELTALPVMASGAAGSTSIPTWSAVPVVSFAPPTASVIRVVPAVVAVGSANLILAPNNAYGAAASTTNPPPIQVLFETSVGATYGICDLTLESQNIFWAATGNGLLQCSGWDDNI
jgi:hypothetical protein